MELNAEIVPNSAKIAIPRVLFSIVFVKLITLGSLNSFADSANSHENLDAIAQTAAKYLEENSNAADNPSIEIKLNSIDPRLKLRKCSEQLEAYFPPGSKQMGKVTVGIRCFSPVTWKVFVSASIYEYAEVVVASRNISRNSVIEKTDISRKRVNISTLRKEPIFDTKQVIGSSPKRQIRAGTILFEGSICMVCRGDDVQVIAKNEFLRINMEGTALGDAVIGEFTQIRNKQSKRSFRAKVTGRNQLEVVLNAIENSKL